VDLTVVSQQVTARPHEVQILGNGHRTLLLGDLFSSVMGNNYAYDITIPKQMLNKISKDRFGNLCGPRTMGIRPFDDFSIRHDESRAPYIDYTMVWSLPVDQR
jgi:hypothetical protein